MNTTITIQNRIWLPLVAAGVALALAVGLLTFVVLQQRTSETPGTTDPPVVEVATELPQAEWKVSTRVEGGNRIPKADKARGEERAAEVSTVVEEIFDAIYLDPAAAPNVLKARFTRPAAAALDPGLGLPEGATDVQTTRRKAVVSVYAGTGEQATAIVMVGVKGTVEGRPFVVRQGSKLWLERDEGDWQVIAFEIDQRP